MQCGHEPAQFGWCVLNRPDFWKSAADFGRCVGHCYVHTPINSSVVVMVASRDSVLSMIAVP
jgi:hypothetical protein